MAVYTLSNYVLRISVNSLGAELCSVKSAAGDIEYIWQADSSIWARHAPHLFPIVGKLNNNSYYYQNKLYQLPQHGFARDLEFSCIEQSSDSLVFELTASEQTLINFPFHFSLKITYTLQNNSIAVSYSVFNPDNKELYFSIGAHPAFNCPLKQDERFSDYELQFNELDHLILHKLHDGLISGETEKIELGNRALSLSPQLFEKDAMVLKNNQITGVKLRSKKTGHGVSMQCNGWPYFGIWTKPGTSKFLCLEPWYGLADTFNSNTGFENKEGIMLLETENYFNASFTLEFF